MQSKFNKLLYIFVLSLSMVLPLQAAQEFVIQDIRVEGLKRISPGTVFNYLPMKVGDTFDDSRSTEAVKALFKTGFFEDVRLERDGNILVFLFIERPAIGSIQLTGNEDIETEQLLENLKQVGFAEGRVFRQSQLDQVEQELRRQYYSFGKYALKISSTVTELDDNRIGILIEISEGLAAKIKKINIVGNTVFKEKKLLKQFELDTGGLLSFYTKSDQYSKQKLSGDLEALRSFYLDDGYLNFNVDSTQVSITPDKKDIYITINISEGEQYTVREVKLAGDILLPEQDLFELISISANELFSRKEVTDSSKKLTEKLGEEGYSFANVNSIPEINEDDKTVALTFFIDPGKRVYVRRINFTGNSKTRDEVLRREMRQQEGAWISTTQVERGKLRLQRTGYFREVNVETVAVPGTTDQVDVNHSVEEAPGGSLSAGFGYSQNAGLVITTSVSQDNFLGSGKRVSFQFNNSDVNTRYGIGYLNPYYTVDGVSRGFNAFYRETDAGDANLSDFESKDFGGSVNFGIPVSENNFLSTALEYTRTEVSLNNNASTQIVNFINTNGSEYDLFKVSAGFRYDTRNKKVLPDNGVLHRISTEISLPGIGDSLEFYKVDYETKWFKDIYEDFVLNLGADIGYGDSYGDTTELPFFENFYAGGPRSVRGYEENTLGPRDSFDRALGGNTRVVGNAELIIPVPFLEDFNSVRVTGFFDAGNVFGPDEDLSFDEIRYSTGVSAIWISPFGAVSASVALPLADKAGDKTQPFQFTFGTSF